MLIPYLIVTVYSVPYCLFPLVAWLITLRLILNNYLHLIVSDIPFDNHCKDTLELH